ncbi:MAG: hypothetical protein A3C03_01575 [Candidatus Colwellbacteria bacterium RIFCSPHIGHO2_02_FULL_45_17]|uniref:Nudix hydrolase domain-containing protein n=2 Tax=Candidatus Colwelliibacteriota TaxID=1817904 RepID=A0A1G1ZBP5_9BACT|nr:MAG: hypothetical protein A3C03_01575 [Candidatus Colwellbacteria bacterium RIFCSPHIGHO2_02_FULL_45_17]OGY61123.1 MAG: hypothetical protein A3I33_01405 [Candidatus Colwellbacteria bacterium RIFCSPLOWO2_02_FULL_45_11]OGY61944.1 MAG: hypothetical protein A3G58_02750 [Candidatus Colwellbacteria bacterium RIFCSPLOWO2_12_FULL_46_17]
MLFKNGWQKVIVTSKVIITNSDGDLLVLLRGETAPSRPLKWDLPGGLVEKGESPLEAGKRETEEEAGVKPNSLAILDVDYTVYRDGFKYPIVSFTYTCSLDNCSGDVRLSYEHKEYKWVSRDEFIALDIPEKYKTAARLLQ